MIINIKRGGARPARYYAESELYNPTDPGLGDEFPFDTITLGWLDVLREIFGPIEIVSGYRSPQHPIEAAKEKPGTHATGQAADLRTLKVDLNFANAQSVMAVAWALGCRRFGWNRGRSTIHIDSLAPRTGTEDCWTYDGSDPYVWMDSVKRLGEIFVANLHGVTE